MPTSDKKVTLNECQNSKHPQRSLRTACRSLLAKHRLTKSRRERIYLVMLVAKSKIRHLMKTKGLHEMTYFITFCFAMHHLD